MKLPFLKSSKTTEAEVSEKIFGVEINKDLIAQLIKIYIENSHPGTDPSTINVEQLALGSLSKANVIELLNKISQDILFLEDRIERILKSKTSNDIVLKTYEGMLASRRAVLETCRQHTQQAMGE